MAFFPLWSKSVAPNPRSAVHRSFGTRPRLQVPWSLSRYCWLMDLILQVLELAGLGSLFDLLLSLTICGNG